MSIRPDLVDLSKILDTCGALQQSYRAQPEHLERRHQTPHKYIGVLTAEAGGANDPELTAEDKNCWTKYQCV